MVQEANLARSSPSLGVVPSRARQRQRTTRKRSTSRVWWPPKSPLARQGRTSEGRASFVRFPTEDSRRSHGRQPASDRQIGGCDLHFGRAQRGGRKQVWSPQSRAPRPVDTTCGRLDACQPFVERARKRFVAAEDAVTKALQTNSRLESELEEGMQRRSRRATGQPVRRPRGRGGAFNSARTDCGGDQPIANIGGRSAAREGSSTIRGVPTTGRGVSSCEPVSSDVDTLRRGSQYNPLAWHKAPVTGCVGLELGRQVLLGYLMRSHPASQESVHNVAQGLLDGMERDLTDGSAQDEGLNRPRRRLRLLFDEQESRHGISDVEDDAAPVHAPVRVRGTAM